MKIKLIAKNTTWQTQVLPITDKTYQHRYGGKRIPTFTAMLRKLAKTV